MKHLNRLNFALASVIASLCGSTVMASSIVTNGTFTTTADPSSFSYHTLDAGGTDPFLPGWTVDSGSVDAIGTYFPTPTGGGQSVDLDGNTPGSISQTISVTAGAKYDVSFEVAANEDGPPPIKGLQVDVSLDSLGHIYNVSNNAHNSPWITEDFQFIATSSTETLLFKSLDDASAFPNQPFGPVIADVAVLPVVGAAAPLPAAAGVGFGMLALFGSLAAARKRLMGNRTIA